MGAPYALYFDSQKLDKLLVVFSARIWRVAYYPLITIFFAGFLLVIAGLLATQPNAGVASLLGALALFSLGWSFLVLRLHLSYWRHDWDATLTVHPQDLMPDTPRHQVQRHVCWLPGDGLNFPTLF